MGPATPLCATRWAFGAAVALGAPLLLWGCTTREVVAVDIGVVTAYPSTASLVDGQNLHFTATVTDADGRSLEGARVTWETDDEEVALIDESGLLLALQEGTTTVRASFRETYGTAFVRVLPGGALQVSRDFIVFYAAAGESPVPAVIDVSVNGFGEIGGLEASAQFAPDQPDGWLVPILADTATPTSLTLTPATSALPAGAYDATVVLDSSDDDDPIQISVSLFVSGLTVTQTAGSTSVTESGGKDSLTVVLAAQPDADVVIDVLTHDPGEVTGAPGRLTFTPSTWNVARTVTLTGTDDHVADGDVTTQVTVTVVDALSDPAFAAVPDEIVLVTTVDDEVPGFTVKETGGATFVTEGRRDELKVLLDVEPVSRVVIRITSADPDHVRVSPMTLTFTPEDWSKSQEVSLFGVQNDGFDGLRLIDVILAVDAAVSDDAFDSVPDQVIQARFFDGLDNQ